MDRQTKKISPALIWTAGISMILFFATGTAAIMGWIPASMGHSVDAPPPVSAPNKSAANTTKPGQPKTHSDSGVQKAPVQVASAAQVKCSDCGVVESVRELEVKGEGTGLGAVGGAVVGGVLGNQVGGGRGKDVATVVGAVGGVVAGNEIEKRVRATKAYEVSIRMDDGSTRTVREATLPTWRAGDRVKLIDGAIRSNA